MNGGMADGSTRVWVASAEELGAAAGLLAEFRSYLGAAEPSGDSMRASVERIHAAGDGEYLLAARGGEAEGVCQLRYRWSVWTDAVDCWLEDLFVRDEARGAGLGRALVDAAFERARARGCRRIELDTNADNAAALRLYEASGFSREPKGPSPSLLLGRRLD